MSSQFFSLQIREDYFDHRAADDYNSKSAKKGCFKDNGKKVVVPMNIFNEPQHDEDASYESEKEKEGSDKESLQYEYEEEEEEEMVSIISSESVQESQDRANTQNDGKNKDENNMMTEV